MKDRPILFSAPMVKALLEGRKTQTRRIVKNRHVLIDSPEPNALFVGENFGTDAPGGFCPYGIPGDRLWVKETWADTNGESGPMLSYKAGGDRFLMDDPAFLEPDGSMDYTKTPNCLFTMWCGDLRRGESGHRWRNLRYMPRWASRILLEIAVVRVERLHNISGQDAWSEGVPCSSWLESDWDDDGYPTPYSKRYDRAREEFEEIWESINGPGSWDANPWVWVIEFKVVEEGEQLNGTADRL